MMTLCVCVCVCVLGQIADLGLATHQTWSKLTKDESRRQSRMGLEKKTSARAAGTLCYMAPEHLKSIHAASTEKSDVYSFAIVVWVILTRQEPYESEHQALVHCWNAFYKSDSSNSSW